MRKKVITNKRLQPRAVKKSLRLRVLDIIAALTYYRDGENDELGLALLEAITVIKLLDKRKTK